jgi:hypothetical protein
MSRHFSNPYALIGPKRTSDSTNLKTASKLFSIVGPGFTRDELGFNVRHGEVQQQLDALPLTFRIILARLYSLLVYIFPRHVILYISFAESCIENPNTYAADP